MSDLFEDFIKRFKIFIEKNPSLITTTLSNIFTMRLVGNKTHGDLAEIAMSEFVNQYMYDFRSTHTGKDLYRAKSQEEDIRIIREIDNMEFPISLKAYGTGPLQLSTDKSFLMFPRLEKEDDVISNKSTIDDILSDSAFSDFGEINVLPLIYDEHKQRCQIMIFDYVRARQEVANISRVNPGKGGRKHPMYQFSDKSGNYICEVRYGGPDANALQRGLWTHTEKGAKYFESITNGWVGYSHNTILVKLFSHALVSSQSGHSSALQEIKKDIERLREEENI